MSAEQEYQVLHTGRVKSAGVPLDVVFEDVGRLRYCPRPQDAEAAIRHFADLRNAPPDEIRDRFFPRHRANKSMFKNGSLLLRSILKTDQGAGKFLPFSVGQAESPIRYEVGKESGYCMYEAYFEEQLATLGFPQSVMNELDQVREFFQDGNIAEAQLAYERLGLVCDQLGLVYERQAQVGRDALFFIRPAEPKTPIVLPSRVKERVAHAIELETCTFNTRTRREREHFAKTHGLSVLERDLHGPIYFQADVQVSPDGNAVVDQVQCPDVGLFLIDKYLEKKEIPEDVLHFYISSQASPVPVFRYDLRGLQIALNYIQEHDEVMVRSVPVSPSRAILFENNRPLYCVFRFMVVEEGL